MDIERLDWDSKFFKLNIFKIEKLNESIHNQLNEHNFHLAYLFSKQPINNNLSKCDIQLTDQKITYKKSNLVLTENLENIMPYLHKRPGKKLLELALQAGEYSRFRVDKNIAADKFEELYKIWIKNSVNKKVASEVLVSMDGRKITGFITLSKTDKYGSIGLIAVDQNYRGKGIGKKLLQAAENWFIKNNLHEIQVVTQQNNTSACNFYENFGYKKISTMYVYHIWRESTLKAYQ